MITAIILAAGQSKRMGQPKMLLTWGETTVLGKVIETVQVAGIDQIIVIAGSAREQVEGLVTEYGLRVVYNSDHEGGEMLSSLQCGLRVISESTISTSIYSDAVLICLGDQPQIQEGIIRSIANRFLKTGSSLIVPSYLMQRGHPWLVSGAHWDEILQMQTSQTPRDFLHLHASEIDYINVDNSSIISDLDTCEDYLKSRP